MLLFIISFLYFYEGAKFSHYVLGNVKHLKTIWVITAGFPVIGILVAIVICIYMIRASIIYTDRFEHLD